MLNGNEYNFDSAVNSDITIAITFKDYTHTVKFDTTGCKQAIGDIKVKHGKSIENLPTAESSSQETKFYGWLDSENKVFMPGTPITSDITLKAGLATDWVVISSAESDSRNIDIASATPIQYKAKLLTGTEIETSKCTWSIPELYSNVVTITNDGKLSVAANSVGGDAYIKVEATPATETFTGYYRVHVSSLSKLDKTSLESGYAKAKNTNITGDIIIPDYYCMATTSVWHSINEVSTNGFKDCNEITSVKISETAYEIGNYAFAGCTKLTKVLIGESVHDIGVEAFKNCYLLKEINIPAKVKDINNNAFRGSLLYPGSKVVFENTLGWNFSTDRFPINPIALADSELAADMISNLFVDKLWSHEPDSAPFFNLKAVILEKNDDYISMANLFTNNNADFSYSQNDIVNEVGKGDTYLNISAAKAGETTIYAKRNESYKEDTCKVTVQETTNLKYSAIGDKHGIVSINDTLSNIFLPAKIKHNGEDVDITAIGNAGFKNTTKLQYIYLNDNIQLIGEEAFAGSSLSSVILTPTSTIQTICDSAFEDCEKLAYLNLPDTVTEIGNYAFNRCKILPYVNLGNSLTKIGTRAFHQCEELQSIILPHTLVEIKDEAFANCSSLLYAIYDGTGTEFLQNVRRGNNLFKNAAVGFKLYDKTGDEIVIS